MRKKKCADGGTLDYTALTTLLSQITDAAGQKDNGTQTNLSATTGGALRGAGVGAKIGSIVPGIGTAIGGGVGAIVGGISSLRRNKKVLENFSELKTREGESRSRMLNQLEEARLLNYDQGTQYQSFYAKGGKLPFSIIGNGSVKVGGKKHEQGGVKLGNTEVEKGEVIHGNKVYSDRLKIPGTKSTYAQEAQRLSNTSMYKTLEHRITGLEKGNSNLKMNMYQSGTMVRNLQKTIGPLETLFNLQEAHKMKSGIGTGRKMAMGGNLYDETPIQKGVGIVSNYLRKNKKDLLNLKLSPEQRMAQEMESTKITNNKIYDKRAMNAGLLGTETPDIAIIPNPTMYSAGINGALAGYKGGIKPAPSKNSSVPFTGKNVLNKVGELVPYADNIVNAILTNKSPQIPIPKTEVSPKLKTKFNIQPQLSDISRNNAATNRTLRDNVSDGAALRGALTGQNINSINARNSLLGQKENIETELVNKQAILDSDTANRNAGILNAYDLRKFGRNADQQTRISQNTANLVEDVNQQIVDKKLDKNDQINLELILAKYKKSGVLDRAGINRILGK